MLEWGAYLSRIPNKTTTANNIADDADDALPNSHSQRLRGRTKSADSKTYATDSHFSSLLCGKQHTSITSIRPQDIIKQKYNNLTGK